MATTKPNKNQNFVKSLRRTNTNCMFNFGTYSVNRTPVPTTFRWLSSERSDEKSDFKQYLFGQKEQSSEVSDRMCVKRPFNGKSSSLSHVTTNGWPTVTAIPVYTDKNFKNWILLASIILPAESDLRKADFYGKKNSQTK